MRTLNRPNPVRLAGWLLLLLALAGCTAQFVSRYDEGTEIAVTNLQRQVETVLQRADRALAKAHPDDQAEAGYDFFVDQYEQMHVDAALLNSRARAIELNSITIQQSEQLIGWLQNLETLHQGGLSPDIIGVLRTQSEQIFLAMLTFELAKKRQLDPAMISEE